MVNLKVVLNYLSFSIAVLAFVPLFVHLELVPKIVFPLALIAGLVLERQKKVAGTFLATVVSLALFVLYAMQIDLSNVAGPAVNLLVVLLAIRLVSEKNTRDHFQIYALSLFALAALSLFSLTPLFLVYFCLMLFLIAIALVLLTYAATAADDIALKDLKTLIFTAALMPLASVPLILIFFTILPRTQHPLWHFLKPPGVKSTGLSEKLELGSAAAVGETKAVVFRAKVTKLPPELLYWRTIVLNSFNGGAWIRSEPPKGDASVAGTGSPVTQIIFPETGYAGYLPVLNTPLGLRGIRAVEGGDLVFYKGGAPGSHARYEATSVPGADIEVNREKQEFYLRLPASGMSPRVVSLAKSIAERSKDDAGKVSLLENFFEGARLTYATSGLPIGQDAVDQFLFETRKGNCEFFASSFAILLRLAGVPARLVGGYYGGMYNDLGKYYIVGENNAHVWVEALVGKRWITIDPSTLAVNSFHSRVKGGLAEMLALTLDAFSYHWNSMVINYDMEGQLHLLNAASTEMRRVTVPALFKKGFWLIVFPSVLISLIFMLRRTRSTPEEKILKRYLAKVRQEYGVQIDSSMGLLEISQALGEPSAVRFAEIFGGAIYRDRALSPEEIASLGQLIKGCKSQKEKDLRPL